MRPGTEAEWNAAVDGYLKAKVPQLAVGTPSVERLEALAPDVWRVVLEDGFQVVAKHQLYGVFTQGQPHDLLEVERLTLELLGRADCPVPQVLGIDAESQFIFFSWCGEHTLEEAARLGSRSLGLKVVEGLCRISAVFQQHRAALEPHICPGGAKASLNQAWGTAAVAARRGLAYLATCVERVPLGRAAPVLEAMLAQIALAKPCLGPTDYNCRNIVVGEAGVYFIEFAKVGWDWTERRLVQYTTTMGVGQKGGGFGSVLSREAVDLYSCCADGDPRQRAQLLDYHQIALWLNAADRLGCALAKGEEPLLRAWGQPAERLAQLVCCLAAPLSADPLAREFRGWFSGAPLQTAEIKGGMGYE